MKSSPRSKESRPRAFGPRARFLRPRAGFHDTAQASTLQYYHSYLSSNKFRLDCLIKSIAKAIPLKFSNFKNSAKLTPSQYLFKKQNRKQLI